MTYKSGEWWGAVAVTIIILTLILGAFGGLAFTEAHNNDAIVRCVEAGGDPPECAQAVR